ncbi:mitogen-activated protein kinase-binding protein 1 isoform X2 [Histomonas meleagridis]|uniref:mitogen-activated protein kinase-binding protein 1 isoform X2 n=1 Tax=Histomonas meleagridis TaxID=135588 RepID=UPI00355AA8C3|nr:mitogen-activated protein kinase-binding protein 1 isoform X2 [Histomonas meleagridis]KAH0805372.1 mitogen-activated protein kinase-binding protein 1 isoform X2 [Histomonas meleagridis]
MKSPILDKIIGTNPIHPNNFDVNFARDACAFVSQCYISIIICETQEKIDIVVDETCREISAISFSQSGSCLAVGEKGTDSRLFLLNFSPNFDQLISEKIIPTKERGFSCLSYNSEKNKLISVGIDSNPYLIIWDLSLPRPKPIAYYHLRSIPNKVAMTSDCSLAIASGNSYLKIFQIPQTTQSNPILLRSRNANIGAYHKFNFLDACFSTTTPFSLYTLTNDGTLCYFESTINSFDSKTPLILTPIKLNRGETTALGFDGEIILCGTSQGILFVLKKEGNKHKVIGKFTDVNSEIKAVGVTLKYVICSYEDGHLLIWKKDFSSNRSPVLTLSNHRGPINKIFIVPSTNNVITCGSDGTVRMWELQRKAELISKSSQSLISCLKIQNQQKDYINQICGIRCCTVCNNFVVVGDNDGYLHVISIDNFVLLKSFMDSNDSVMDIAVNSNVLVTAGGDGVLHFYDVDFDLLKFTLVQKVKISDKPLLSVIFAGERLVAASSLNGIKFIKTDSFNVIASDENHSILHLSYLDRPQLIVACCIDQNLTLYCTSTYKIFRQFNISHTDYPVCCAIHPSCLVIAVAMSNGNVLLLDTISGETVLHFSHSCGVVTSIAFHEGDLLLSTFTGCLIRWNMPTELRNELEKRPMNPNPLSLLTLEEFDNKQNKDESVRLSCSYIRASGETISKFDNQEYQVEIDSEQKDENANYEEEDSEQKLPIENETRDNEGDTIDKVIISSLTKSKNNQISETDEIFDIRLPPMPPAKSPKKSPKVEVKEENIDIEDETQIRSLSDDDISEKLLINQSLLDEIPDRDEEEEEKIVEEELSEKMMKCANNLKSMFSQANEFLSQKLDTEDEIESQKKLKSLMETFDEESKGYIERKEKIKKMKEYTNEMKKNAVALEENLKRLKSLIDFVDGNF